MDRSSRSFQRSTSPAAASLIRRAPSEPPNTATVGRSSGRPSDRRAAAAGLGARSTAAISGRTGVPVTTARGSGFPSQPTALARANRPKQPVGRPGHGVDVDQDQGHPEHHGGRATPAGWRSRRPTPPPGAGPGPPARRPAAAATASPATAAERSAPGRAGRRLRTMPRPGSSVTGKPRPSRVDPVLARGSIRRTRWLSRACPASTSASAMARAGWRWPAVPPPATRAIPLRRSPARSVVAARTVGDGARDALLGGDVDAGCRRRPG